MYTRRAGNLTGLPHYHPEGRQRSDIMPRTKKTAAPADATTAKAKSRRRAGKPAADQPAQEQPVSEQVAQETAPEQTAADLPQEQPPAGDPVAEAPAAEPVRGQPADAPTHEPATEQPATDGSPQEEDSPQERPAGKRRRAKATGAKKAPSERPAAVCTCGCGGTTGGGKFLPGHDARLKSELLRAFRGEGLSAEQQQLVEQLDWERFLTPAPAGQGPSRLERARALLAKLTDTERDELLADYAVPVKRIR
jgi:hypothetical protein